MPKSLRLFWKFLGIIYFIFSFLALVICIWFFVPSIRSAYPLWIVILPLGVFCMTIVAGYGWFTIKKWILPLFVLICALDLLSLPFNFSIGALIIFLILAGITLLAYLKRNFLSGEYLKLVVQLVFLMSLIAVIVIGYFSVSVFKTVINSQIVSQKYGIETATSLNWTDQKYGFEITFPEGSKQAYDSTVDTFGTVKAVEAYSPDGKTLGAVTVRPLHAGESFETIRQNLQKQLTIKDVTVGGDKALFLSVGTAVQGQNQSFYYNVLVHNGFEYRIVTVTPENSFEDSQRGLNFFNQISSTFSFSN